MTPEPTPAETAIPAATRVDRVQVVRLRCDVCGQETTHRILRVNRPGGDPASGWGGVARCQVCRWTHPFEVSPAARVELVQILSEGPRSERTRLSLPRGRRLQVGSGLPESEEPVTIRRIEDRSGASVSRALTDSVATVWVTRDRGTVVPVSVVEGSLTRGLRVTLPPETVLAVGGEIQVDRGSVRIVALRARGRNWRRSGDRFRALEVSRVYARRTEIPPAGRRAWSRVRGTTSSRASSTSRSARSRSGPGVSRNRAVPRRRTASGGATVQSVSRS